MFFTHLLDEVLRAKRTRREIERRECLSRVFEALSTLAREIPFDEAYVFGSLAKPGRFVKGSSDVDIGFIGLRDEHFFRAGALLSTMLCSDVDVVQLEGHPLAERVKEEGIRWMH